MTDSDDLHDDHDDEPDDLDELVEWEAKAPEIVHRTVEMLAALDRGAWRTADLGNPRRQEAWETSHHVPPLDDDRIPYRFFTGDPRADFLTGDAQAHRDTPDEIDLLGFPMGEACVPRRYLRSSTFTDTFRMVLEVVESLLGPPDWWGGASPSQWALWPLGEDRLVVTLDWDLPRIEMHLRRGRYDALAPSTGWRAATLGRLPYPAPEHTPAPADWEQFEKRLAGPVELLALHAQKQPGLAIVHLGSRLHPHRLVSFWTEGFGVRVEALGFRHEPTLADAGRLADQGWERDAGSDTWDRRLPEASWLGEERDAAARMLVGALRMLEVDLADLTYYGTVGHRGHLELPGLGVHRTVNHPAVKFRLTRRPPNG